MSVATLGITMGDPSGVGPEIICKALAKLSREQRSQCLVIGGGEFLLRANALCGSGLSFGTGSGDVAIEAVETPLQDEIRDSTETAGGGHAAHGYVVRAVELAESGAIGAIVTAPLNKAALHMAGHKYDGHTELLQHLTGAPSSYMLLASETLKVAHVTTHVSLNGAIKGTRTQRILDTMRAGRDHLRRLGIDNPRIACAGLNPHCGEGGLFGHEDTEQIVPAVAAARAEGIEASGPYAADTVFYRASQGEFDLVIANYHDQGHIPVKLIAFHTAVNVSLGLPIERCSVDHGTAFDIAWTGKADPTNMLSALDYGRRIAETPAAAP